MKTKKTSSVSILQFVSLLLIVCGAVLIYRGFNSEPSITSSFASEPVDSGKLDSYNVDGNLVPRKIIIPSLNLDLDIQASKRINGYWEVFEDRAGWGEGSGLPGVKGNQVIFAHARPNLFGDLRNVKTGQSIFVLTDSKWYQYSVKEIKTVYPNNISVIEPTIDETLTLYTCSGFSDNKRLIVIAKRN